MTKPPPSRVTWLGCAPSRNDQQVTCWRPSDSESILFVRSTQWTPHPSSLLVFINQPDLAYNFPFSFFFFSSSSISSVSFFIFFNGFGGGLYHFFLRSAGKRCVVQSSFRDRAAEMGLLLGSQTPTGNLAGRWGWWLWSRTRISSVYDTFLVLVLVVPAHQRQSHTHHVRGGDQTTGKQLPLGHLRRVPEPTGDGRWSQGAEELLPRVPHRVHRQVAGLQRPWSSR